MLLVAFFAEKALAGAAEGHCLFRRISATFVTGRKDPSLDLTSISSQHRPVVQVGVFRKFFHRSLTERGGSVAGGAANGDL